MGLKLGAVLSLLPAALPDMSQSDAEAEALLRESEAGEIEVSGAVALPAVIPEVLPPAGEVTNAPGTGMGRLQPALPPLDLAAVWHELKAILTEVGEGSWATITLAQLRSQLAGRLELEGGVLDAWKDTLGDMVVRCMAELRDGQGGERSVADASVDGLAASDLLTALLEDAGEENLAAQQHIYLGTASRILPDTLASTDLIDLSMLTRAEVGKKVHDSWHLMAFHGSLFSQFDLCPKGPCECLCMRQYVRI